MELFIKYPDEVQQELLMQLLRTAEDTLKGIKYGFNDIRSYETFAERVPICIYEDIAQEIEQSRLGAQNLFWPTPIKWYAKSSGTTNAKSKLIPVSKEALEDCHYKAGKDLLCMYLNNNEGSKMFEGKSLRLGGSKQPSTINDTFFGDLSAILIENMPKWATYSSTPSVEVSLMNEWETKMKAIVEESMNENVTNFAGVPSWMLVLLNQVLEESGKRDLTEVWPNLEAYFHGGVSFEPYREQYQKIIPKSSFQYYETYNASEGFFAIQDRNNSDELLLMLDYGIFYEFVPMTTYGTPELKAIPLSEVELDVNYAVVITTNSGLWRYMIGDTVRFTSLKPYRIRVTGRTKHHINVFGEELMIENADKAVAKACEETGLEVIDYSAAPIFMKEREKGSHEWMIEFRSVPQDITKFSRILDATLKELNSDYEAKRYNDMTLAFPTINVARPRLFYDWLKREDKLGGQHKIPRLSNTREYMDVLKRMNIQVKV